VLVAATEALIVLHECGFLGEQKLEQGAVEVPNVDRTRVVCSSVCESNSGCLGTDGRSERLRQIERVLKVVATSSEGRRYDSDSDGYG